MSACGVTYILTVYVCWRITLSVDDERTRVRALYLIVRNLKNNHNEFCLRNHSCYTPNFEHIVYLMNAFLIFQDTGE